VGVFHFRFAFSTMLTKKPFRCSRGFTLALFVGVLLACGIRQDEFDCENAVAHLAECCPGFSPTTIECTYSPYCTTTYPEIDIADSDCIRNESCEDLVGTGVCGRVEELPANMASTSAVSASPVCGPGAAPYVAPAQEDAGGASEDSGFSILCLSASDCAGGQACCVDLSTTSSACGFAPCPSGFQLCATSAECAVGLSCVPVVMGVMACGTQVDGGGVSFGSPADAGDGGGAADAADAQAATDAPDDVGAESAPDAGEGG
jgi:hypothetical protein